MDNSGMNYVPDSMVGITAMCIPPISYC